MPVAAIDGAGRNIDGRRRDVHDGRRRHHHDGRSLLHVDGGRRWSIVHGSGRRRRRAAIRASCAGVWWGVSSGRRVRGGRRLVRVRTRRRSVRTSRRGPTVWARGRSPAVGAGRRVGRWVGLQTQHRPKNVKNETEMINARSFGLRERAAELIVSVRCGSSLPTMTRSGPASESCPMPTRRAARQAFTAAASCRHTNSSKRDAHSGGAFLEATPLRCKSAGAKRA
jgi:hypothetical protein